MEAEIQTEVMAIVAGRFITFSLEFLELVHNPYIKPSYTVAYRSCHVRTHTPVTICYYARSKAEIEERRHITLKEVVTGFGIYRNRIEFFIGIIHRTGTYTCVETRRELTTET